MQGVIRTIRSAIEENWEVKIDVTHFVWPWIAEQSGFLLPTRFEVGRETKRKISKGTRLVICRGNLVDEEQEVRLQS